MRLARLNHTKAMILAEHLSGVDGVKVINDTFFNEFTIQLSKCAAQVVETLADRNILAGVPVSRLIPGDNSLTNQLLVTATEMTTEGDIARLCKGLSEVL